MKNWKTSAESILTTGPVVPVIVVKKLEHAVPMAKALVAGGVRVLEVTLRAQLTLSVLSPKKCLKRLWVPVRC